MKLLVLGNGQKPGVEQEVAKLLPLIRSQAEVVAVDLFRKLDLSDYKADLALVFGGDGAIIRAVQQLGQQQLPILGINLGKLGFLADCNPEQFPSVLPILVGKQFSITTHLMYECVVQRGDQKRTFLGLNEIVFHADPPLHLVQIDLAIDGQNVARFSGDGLILSTPTGSTAHNLSAGGPILRAELDAFVITPICAHTLTFRPLIDEASRTYTVQLHPDSSLATLVIDGQERVSITTQEIVTLRKAPVKFQRVRIPGQNYYQTLREKLNWGTPPKYRKSDEN